MSTRYDAIVIGAGIIGACTAFELAKRGWRTQPPLRRDSPRLTTVEREGMSQKINAEAGLIGEHHVR